MPFSRPTLTELIEEQRAAFDARLSGADSRLRRSILDVLARAVAGAVWLLYGFIAWISRQVFPDTAEVENLERWGTLFSVPRLAGDFASGTVNLVGTDGRTVLAGTELQRSDGVRYTTDADATIVAGVASVGVTAEVTGSAGNAFSGVTLTFLAPVAGVDPTATVDTDGLAGGLDLESDDDYRERVIDRFRLAPQGGAAHDYVTWAKLSDPDVTDVYVHTHQFGAGTVGVAPLYYDRADPLPLSADLAVIQSGIDERRPALADVTVYALVASPVDFTLSVSPDTPAIRAAIEAELKDLFRRESRPGSVDAQGNSAPLLISHIREAISAAEGEFDHSLSSPSTDEDLAGDLTLISTVGDFTWT